MVAARSHIQAHTVSVTVLDMVCLLIGGAVGVALRIGHEEMGEYVFDHLDGWLVFFGSVVLANYLAGSYRLQHTFSRFNLVVTWAFSLSFALVVLTMTSYAWFRMLLGRGVLLLSVASYSITSLIMKVLVFRYLFRSQFFLCRTAVVGTGESARAVRRTLEREFVIPAHRVTAFIEIVEDSREDRGGDAVIDGVAVLESTVDSLESVVQGLGVNLIVLVPETRGGLKNVYPHLRRLRFAGVEVLTPLSVEELYGGRTPLTFVDEDYLMQASMESGLPLVWRAKRLMDIIVSVVGIVIFLPIAAAIAICVKMSGPGSGVIYSQIRTGQFGKEFRLFKFRTMREGVETETGPVWAGEQDPRITPVGRVLRRYRLDEIPQIVNILKGDMSIVGPRPERPEFITRLAEEIPFYAERENVKPGLTGWAQIRYPYGSSVEDAARKLEYDLYYMKHLSLSMDLQIILSTLRIVIFGKERVM